MSREIQMINTEFPTEMLDRFIFAAELRKSSLYIVEKPMTSEHAFEFLGVSPRTFTRLVNSGQIKPHFFKGLSTPFYFPSEMYETLKKS